MTGIGHFDWPSTVEPRYTPVLNPPAESAGHPDPRSSGRDGHDLARRHLYGDFHVYRPDTYTKVRGSSEQYTVAGKSMPFIVIGTALAAQAIDGNATLGNASLTYASGFWAGAAIPIGLAASLFIVGRFLAAPLNAMNLMTLPEYFYRRYGKFAEALASLLTRSTSPSSAFSPPPFSSW